MIDGVIKYHVEHEEGLAPEFSGYPNLEALRSRLFALGLIGEKDGIGYGNLSKRLGQSHTFFITATQTGKQAHLISDSYTYIEDYDFESFTVFSKGTFKPSSEALSHAMIYEIDQDINVVIHIHSHALWLFMQAKHYLATEAEYGTVRMVNEIRSLYKNINPFTNNAFVMKGHEDGIITFGRNVDDAERTLYGIIQRYLNL